MRDFAAQHHALADWTSAHDELTRAQLEVVRCELSGAGPVPDALSRRVDELQARADLLFEAASVLLADPHPHALGWD